MAFPSDEQASFPDWFKHNFDNVCVLTGYAGSGKTSVMKLLEDNLDGTALWCSPTHQASSILSGKIESGALTLASALGLGRVIVNGAVKFLPKFKNKITGNKYLIVDEASMIGRDMLKMILENKYCKILFVGDPAQLPPVKEIESPVFSSGYDTYNLSNVYRQDDKNIIDYANDVRTRKKNDYKRFGIQTKTIEAFYGDYPNGMAVCPTHATKDLCNRTAKKILGRESNQLFLESPIMPPNGPSNGDIVNIVESSMPFEFLGFMVKKTIVECKKGFEYEINIPVDESEQNKFRRHLSDLEKQFKYDIISEKEKQKINRRVEMLSDSIVLGSAGFAMTIHKSQGSTLDNVLFCVAGIKSFQTETRWRMAYTAITRAKENLYLCL